MGFLDKSGVVERTVNGECVVLELGCGPRKRNAEALGVDMLDYPGVDLVGDVFEILAALPAGSVASVHAYHFFEHVSDLAGLLDALAQVMRKGALLDIEVPHFANPYFYSDPTHTKFFGLYTMSYFAEEELFFRKVPKYGREITFRLAAASLDFNSPFPVRGFIKRLIGPLFNLTPWLQEFHEENLCHVLPCYQLRFELHRL